MRRFALIIVAVLAATPCFGQASGGPTLPANKNIVDLATTPAPAADRLWFYDFSESKWQPLTLGSNLSIAGTTLNAAGEGGGGTGDANALAADPSSNGSFDASEWISDLGLAGLFQPLNANLTTWAGVTPSANGQSLVSSANYASMRGLLDLETGVDVQAYSATLASWASKTPPSGSVVGTTDTQALSGKSFASITVTGGSITGITDLAIADGGTGASTLPSGLLKGAGTSAITAAVAGTDYLAPAAIGVTVQGYDADLGVIGGLADPNADRILFWDDSAGAYAYLTVGSGLSIAGTTITASGGGGGAPDGATYITQTPDGTLSGEQALSALGTGLLKNTTGTGVLTIAAAGTDYVAPDADLTSIAGGVTGIVKGAGNGGGYSAATAGTDYYAPGSTDVAVADGGTGASTLTGIVKGNGTSAFTAAVAGTDYLAPAAIGVTVQAFDSDLTTWAGVTSSANGQSLVQAANYAAMRGLLGVDEGNAPLVRVSSLGVRTAYGVGAANAAALGAALETAAGALSSGDSLIIYGPAEYETDASLNPPAGVSIIGIGQPTIVASGLTDPAIIVDNSDTLVSGLSIETNTVGIGAFAGSPVTATGIVIKDVRVIGTASSGGGVMWGASVGGGSTQHQISATLLNCDLTGGSGSGFGFFAGMGSAARIRLVNVNTDGETDGILVLGNSAAELEVEGGTHLSTLDAVTTNGPTIYATLGRSRGDQADVFEDGGDIILRAWDFRQVSAVGDVQIDIGGGVLVTVNDSLPLRIPVNNGGTGVSTITGLVKGNGFSPMTAAVAGTDYLDPDDAGATGLSALAATTASGLRDAAGASSGVFAGSVVASATTSAAGVSELATSGEVTTGSDTGRTITPDALRASDYGKRTATIILLDDAADVTVADPVAAIPLRIPAEWNGWNLVAAAAAVAVDSSSGDPTWQVERHRGGASVDMLSTPVTLDDDGDTDSSTASAQPAIDTSNDDVQTGDKIYVRCTQAGTGTKGTVFTLTFAKP